MPQRRRILLVIFCVLLLCCFPVRAGAVKLLALTFDDGPSPVYTPQVVSVLDAEKVKATFFLVGKWLPGKTDLVRGMLEDGQQIGNHTYDHVKLTGLSKDDIVSEVQRGEDALRKMTGQASFLVRPPFGARSDAVIADIPAPVILWSIDPAGGKQVSGSVMAQKIITKARDGDIILLHDTTQANLDAVRTVIDTLHGRGFEFVTVNELLRLRHVTPRAGVAYKRVTDPAPQGFDESKLGDHWAYTAIRYLEQKGYMTGDAGGWHPNRYLTRAMAVTVLWRLCGSSAPLTEETGFSDVPEGEWDSAAIAWAQEKGMVQGETQTWFGGNDLVTREQLYVLTARLPESLRQPSVKSTSCHGYGDDARIDDWALDGVTKLRQLGFVSANDKELFRPKDPATRAEAAELFQWFCTGRLVAGAGS